MNAILKSIAATTLVAVVAVSMAAKPPTHVVVAGPITLESCDECAAESGFVFNVDLHPAMALGNSQVTAVRDGWCTTSCDPVAPCQFNMSYEVGVPTGAGIGPFKSSESPPAFSIVIQGYHAIQSDTYFEAECDLTGVVTVSFESLAAGANLGSIEGDGTCHMCEKVSNR